MGANACHGSPTPCQDSAHANCHWRHRARIELVHAGPDAVRGVFGVVPRAAAGEEIIDAHRGVNTGAGGFIAGAEEHNFELAPVLWTFAEPSAPVDADAWRRLKTEVPGAPGRRRSRRRGVARPARRDGHRGHRGRRGRPAQRHSRGDRQRAARHRPRWTFTGTSASACATPLPR